MYMDDCNIALEYMSSLVVIMFCCWKYYQYLNSTLEVAYEAGDVQSCLWGDKSFGSEVGTDTGVQEV